MQINIPDNVAIPFFLNNIDQAHKAADSYNGRCIVCGDSQTDKYKKRFYMYKKGGKWAVYCHNCEYSSSLNYFIKTYYPNSYDAIKSQIVGTMFKKEEKIDLKGIIEANKSRKRTVDAFIKKDCISLKGATEEKIVKVIDYLKNRRIPQSIIDSFYYCASGKRYKDRLIIPFYRNSKPYYFQARATSNKQSPKYLNWKSEEYAEKPEYNEFNVDKDKPTYLTEGIFDSLFVENSICLQGVKVSDDKILALENKYPNIVYCFDNDESGRFWTEKLLKKKRTCFVWPGEYNVKDLNELAMELKVDDLTDFVKKNTFEGVLGLLHLRSVA